MNWNFLMWFGIGLAIYLVGLAIFTIIKYFVNKKRFKKEIKTNVESEDQSQTSKD